MKPKLPMRMMALMTTALLLSACGFHLRGQYAMPNHLQALTLTVPAAHGALKSELELALERVNVSTVGGDTELEVVREVLTKQTTTVDSRAKAAEYTLIYSVDYRTHLKTAKAPGKTQSLILRRGYQYDSTSVVGKSTEEENLVRELRQDVARQIVRQLRNWTPPAEPAAVAP